MDGFLLLNELVLIELVLIELGPIELSCKILTDTPFKFNEACKSLVSSYKILARLISFDWGFF